MINPTEILSNLASGQNQNNGNLFQSGSTSQLPSEGQIAPMPEAESILPANAPSIEDKLKASDLGSFSNQYTDDLAADREYEKLIQQQYPIEPITGDLGASTYFPGMQEPILKGMSSSKTLGSQPIFVRSGGYFPFGVLDARKKALQVASAERAKALGAFDLPKKPLTKDPRFQEKINKQFDTVVSSYIDRAKGIYGENAFAALKDPKTKLGREFTQALDNIDVVARETDQVVDRISDIKQGMANKTMSYSKETQDLVDRYESLMGEFEGGVMDVKLRENLNLLAGSQDLDKFLNDKVYPKLQYSVNEAWGQFKDKGDFNEARSWKKSTIKNQAKQLAKEVKQDQYSRANWITEDDIYNRLTNMFGDKIESDLRTVSKPGGEQGYDVQPDNLFLQEEKQYNIDGKIINAKNTVGLSQKKNSQPWNLSGAHEINPKDGTTSVAKDIKNFKPIELTRIESTDEKGNSVWTKVLVGTKEVKISKGGKSYTDTKPVYIPVEGNQKIIKQQIPNAYNFFEKNAVGEPTKQKVTIGAKEEKQQTNNEPSTGGAY